jgi:hypothetical protein
MGWTSTSRETGEDYDADAFDAAVDETDRALCRNEVGVISAKIRNCLAK